MIKTIFFKIYFTIVQFTYFLFEEYSLRINDNYTFNHLVANTTVCNTT